VSRRHAVIAKRGDRYFLRDLGSANGTHLGGLLLGSERPLADSTCFRIGEAEIVFCDPAVEPE
jgi:pSer/pThr/pTyr-binding forkhead associated (FHA) protein